MENLSVNLENISKGFRAYLKNMPKEYAKEYLLQCLTNGRNSPECPNDAWLLWEAVLGKGYKCLPSKLDSVLSTLVSAVKQDTTIK